MWVGDEVSSTAIARTGVAGGLRDAREARRFGICGLAGAGLHIHVTEAPSDRRQWPSKALIAAGLIPTGLDPE